MKKVVINHPGAPVNTPQHLVGDEGMRPNPIPGKRAGTAPRGGPQRGPQGLDAADPHPPEEGNPYEARHPGGTNPPKNDLGPNPAVHDGKAPRRPHNAGSGAQ